MKALSCYGERKQVFYLRMRLALHGSTFMVELLRRHIRNWCSSLLAVVILGACASSAPIKPSDLNSVLQDAERKANFVNQFQANFVKTRRLWLFDKELTAEGCLIFQKPGRFWMTLNGDIHVEIVSDGKRIKVIHGKSDEEVFPILGDRDRTRFADPLMLLIDSIGTGGFRKFSIDRTVAQGDTLLLEIRPKNEQGFESTEKVLLVLSKWGEVRKVTIVYRNGNVDETVFKSWALLDSEGPEISRLNQKLRALETDSRPGMHRTSWNDSGWVRLRSSHLYPLPGGEEGHQERRILPSPSGRATG